MSNNEWVQEGTPRDDAEWTEEADDYGVPVEPAEWDDYSDEQAMPVPPRPVKPEPEVEDNATLPTAPDLDDVVAGEDEPLAHDDAPAAAEAAAEEPFADEPVAEDPVAEEPAFEEVASDDEPLGDEPLENEHFGDEPLEDEPLEDEPFEDKPGDDESIVDESVEAEPVDDELVEEEPVLEGGSTKVDPDDLDLDDEPTRVRDAEELSFGRPVNPEPAVDVVPVPAAAAMGAPAAVAAPAIAGLYRTDAEETQVLDTTRRSVEDEAAEEEARAAALQAEREERERRLGMVQTSNANAEREVRPRRRGVGGFGSFGLFVLRLITAGILGIVAYQVLYSIDATAEFLTRQPLIPEPRLVAWIIGFTLAAMAVMLVIGLGVRIVGLLLLAIAVAALVLIRWGSFSPFVEGMEGFLGDKDLLLAGVGILFFSLGGGRFGIDGAISSARADAREAKQS